VRRGRHHCRSGARRAVSAESPGARSARGPSAEPIGKPRAKQGTDADSIAKRAGDAGNLADLRTCAQADSCFGADGRTDTFAVAISWCAEPLAVGPLSVGSA
jgi:hypothetical protein